MGSCGSSARVPAAAAAVIATLALALASAPSATAACPNEAIRAAQSSTYLPDCRAYELVSPQEKGTGDVLLNGDTFSSPSGNAVTYESSSAFASPQAAAYLDQYLSQRGPDGWATQNLTPYQTPYIFGVSEDFHYQAFSPDLSTGVLATDHPPDELNGEAGQDQNQLYLWTASGFTPISPVVSPAPPPFVHVASYAGASSDQSRVFFESTFSLTPDAPPAGVNELYEWSASSGQLRVVGVLPDGTVASAGVVPRAGSPYGSGVNPERAISGDGSQVVFASGSPAQLYLNQDGQTTEISLSQKAGSAGNPAPTGVTFRGTSSTDGATLSEVYFTSHDELTNDANTGPTGEGTDLYAYDVATGSLRDLTPDPTDPNGAQAGGFGNAPVIAAGGYVYFVAIGQLAPGAPFNEESFYAWHEGSITYVGPAPWSGGSVGNREVPLPSEDGRRLLTVSPRALTTDDPGKNPEGNTNPQVYLYDAPSRSWSCLSCLHGRPTPAAASLEGFTTEGSPGPEAINRRRNLSADGRRAFFETATPLVPGAVNGAINVYEWEEGKVSLVSSGTSPYGADFLGSSPSGNDAFIATRARLVGADRDSNIDVYDVRVDGGFVAQNEPPAPPPCGDETCRGPASGPPPATVPGSSTLSTPARRHHRPKHRHAARRHRHRSGHQQGKSNSHRGARSKRTHRHG